VALSGIPAVSVKEKSKTWRLGGFALSSLVSDLELLGKIKVSRIASVSRIVNPTYLVITHILLAQLDSADLSPVSVHESRLKPTCRARPKGFHALSRRL
jgi:hypothetical protein